MKRPFPAYEGKEPYVFVCYAHEDKAEIYPEIIRLKNAGHHIWYDEGISPGSEWSDALANAIAGCSVFLYYVTPRSVTSEHCRREVNFALEQPCGTLAVHLEPTELPDGLKLTLSNRQAILRYDEPRTIYVAKLAHAIRDAQHQDVQESATLGRLTLGEWTLDLATQRLTRGDESHPLDPKALSVLLHLIDRAPEVVSREGLLSRTWHDVVVGDNVLDQAIAQLRRSFGDNPRNPRYIETLARRGYRLVAPVASTEVAAKTARVAEHQLGRRQQVPVRWAVAVLAAFSLATVGWWTTRPQPMENAGVFVAPLANQSDDTNVDYHAQGLRDELVHQLARIPTLAVRQTDDGTGYRISGSLAPDGGKVLAISLQMSRRGRTVWSDNYSAPRNDRIRSRVAVAQIATESAYGIIRKETDLTGAWETYDENAKLAFLRGFTMYTGGRLWGTQESAQSYFEQAIRLDPTLTQAYAMKALTYIGAVNAYSGGIGPRKGFAEARALVDRALQIDSNDVWALAVSVDVKRYDQDWEGAEDTVQRILELTSTPPPSVAEHLAYCGRYDEALRIIDQLILADPVSGANRVIKAHALLLARRDAEARAVLDEILATQPDNPRAKQLQTGLLESAGQYAEAYRAFGLPEEVHSREEFGNAWLDMARAAERHETTTLPGKIWRFYVHGYNRLGEYRNAVRWLEKGWETGDRLEFWAMRSYPYPGFDEMRATREYQNVLDRTIGRPATCPGYAGPAGAGPSAITRR